MRRTMLGMSQSRLGELLGVTFQQIQKYEKGSNRISASRLQHTARVLEVSPGYFFEGAPSDSAEPGFAEESSQSYVVDFLASTEGLQLNRAFLRVRDPKVRRRIVDLVIALASPQDESVDRSFRSINRTNRSKWLDGPNGHCQKRLRAIVGCPRTAIRGDTRQQEIVYMARQNYEFTSESVSEGHPDKVCDRISDEIVDLFFREGAKAGLDPYQIRVACETLATTNRVVIAGEVRGPNIANEEMEATVRNAIKEIGYEQDGFHWRNAKVEVLLTRSPRTLRKAWTPAATRMKARATRASCSATPAVKLRN